MSAADFDSGTEPNPDRLVNPYSTPEAALESSEPAAISFVKATRAQRLAAFTIDALLCATPWMVIWVTGVITGGSQRPDSAVAMVFAGFGVAVVLGMIVLGVQIVMLYRDSWTVGKRVLGIKIVRVNGEPAGLARIVFLRTLLPLVISMFPLCCLPAMLATLGPWLAPMPSVVLLIDPLLILGRERRCGHDYVADTIVVKA